MPHKTKSSEPWERHENESAQAFEAFSVYLEMGADRSQEAVSRKLAKSRQLISRWSSTYQWVDRSRAWDTHLQREAQKAAVAEVRAMNRRHVEMARQIQDAAMAALQELGADMVTPKNFAAIVRLAVELEREGCQAEVEAVTAQTDGTANEEAGDVVVYVPDNGMGGEGT